MKTAIITGCRGFIATYLVKRCLAEGWSVFGIDKETDVSNEISPEVWENKNFTYLKADICDLKSLPDAQIILHLAAESDVERSITDSTDFIRTNVDGTRNLLDIVRRKSRLNSMALLTSNFRASAKLPQIGEEETGDNRDLDIKKLKK